MVASAKLKMSFAEIQRAVARGLHAAIEKQQIESRAVTVDRSIDQLTWCRRYMPNYFYRQPSRMHEWIAAKLHAARRERGTKLNIIGPRGGAKSTVGNTAYILRCAVEGTEPYILILGKTSKMASKQLGHVKRELEENQLLARDYPEACGKGSSWSESEIRLRNGVVIQAFGVGQDIRGARNAADRPSLVIGDDLQGDDAITSAHLRESDWTWFTGAVLKIGDERTNYVNLATATHREAIAWKLQSTPGWESGVFASIIEWPAEMGLWAQWAEILHENRGDGKSEARAEAFYDANEEAMNRGAVVLWPEHESLYSLMMMRESEGRRPFDREKQSKLAGVDENEWPDEYFDDDKILFDEWPKAWRVKAMALDPSKGKDAHRSDYSAYVMLMVGNDGILYVDADLKRRPPSVMIAEGVELHRKFAPDAFGVEANAWQELLGGEFEDAMAKESCLAVAPHLITNSTNKQVRIRRLDPFLSQRKLRFKAGSPGAALLISQLRDFPDKHSHDDGPDALEMAIRLADWAEGNLAGESTDEYERVE